MHLFWPKSSSHDLIHWQEIGPVLAIKAWIEQPSLEAESPCVVCKDGRFWLFFKHGWWTHVVVSDSPFDFVYRESNRTKGIFLGTLDWPDGDYPKLVSAG